MKRISWVLSTLFLSACGGPAIDTTPLKLDYITAYPDAFVTCQVEEPYALCSIDSSTYVSQTGLWIYEDETFYAVNGKAINAADNMGKERYPDAASIDIPEVLSRFE